jgi:hypothetical protein
MVERSWWMVDGCRLKHMTQDGCAPFVHCHYGDKTMYRCSVSMHLYDLLCGVPRSGPCVVRSRVLTALREQCRLVS